MSGKESVRNRSYEHMRSIACLAIVLMHMMNISEILYRSSISHTEDSVSMLIVYLCMWAVPLFVMVTGALLLDPGKNITIKAIYTRYVARIIGALLLFGLVFRFVDMWMNGETFSLTVITNGLYKIYTGTSWSHLWYLYMLIGLYVLLPVYRRVSAGCDRKELLYLLGAYAFFISILPLTDIFGADSAFHLQTSAIYLLYFFAGYMIKSGQLVIKKPVAALMLVLSVACMAAVWVIRNKYDIAGLDQVLGNYSSPVVVVMAVSIFALMFKNETVERSGALAKFIALFDRSSFGIYLIHMIFLRVFLRHMQINPYAQGVLIFAGVYLATLVLSFVIVVVLHFIPGLRKLV